MTATLNGQQHLLLIQLRSGSWTTTDLAEHFEMQETNVSREMRVLRKKGFVKSVPDNSDKRIRHHHMTDVGREYLNQKWV